MATASPDFFFHCNSVASATDSDSCGTLTSMMAMAVLSFLSYLLSTKPLSLPNAWSSKAFNCSWCRCAYPTAGEADAGRPA